jgi:rhamnosyltransferase
MNIAAIVIWYYPEIMGDGVAIQNILTYSAFCKIIYIVDNSPNNNFYLASQIPNSQYIPNFDNLGIARAQNQGCKAAIDDGYTWVMTMDQDSSWEKEDLFLYISEIEKLMREDASVTSFSPDTLQMKAASSFYKIMKHKIKCLINKKSHTIYPCYEYTDRVLASGNVINLEAWKDAGKFNDNLFIDDVDYDFCYRMIQNGYKIIKIKKCKMNHISGGNSIKTFFHHVYPYSKERLYYITRNKMFIIKNHPEFARKYNYKEEIAKIFLEKIFFLEFSCLKYVIKGYIDGKRNRLGKLRDPKK